MMRRALALGLVLALSVAAFGDYPADRKAATELVTAGKNEEAMAAFTKMAAGDVSEAQKSDALEQAVLCALRLKQVDQALKLAKQIPSVPVSKMCQMRVLAAGLKWDELIAQFKDEALATWPDEVRFDAACLRGQAYFQLKDGKAAEADLKTAAEGHPSNLGKAEASLSLGDTYRDLLKDEGKALDAYAKASGRIGSWITFTAVLSSTDILRKQGKYDDAMKMLQKIDIAKTTGYWRFTFVTEHAEILAGQGKKAEAIAKLEEGIADEAITNEFKKDWERRLNELNAQ